MWGVDCLCSTASADAEGLWAVRVVDSRLSSNGSVGDLFTAKRRVSAC